MTFPSLKKGDTLLNSVMVLMVLSVDRHDLAEILVLESENSSIWVTGERNTMPVGILLSNFTRLT